MNHSPDTQELVDAMTDGRMTQLDLLAHVQYLESQGEHRAAANMYALWINHSQSAGKHFALFNYAALLQNLKRSEEAQVAYESCIAVAPDFPHAYINLGLLHEKQGQHTLALEAWLRLINRRYLEQAPSDEFLTMALNHIGRLQETLKNYDQAEEALEQSLLINPVQPGVVQHWVHIRQKACKWPVYKPIEGVDLADMKRYTSPLAMLALSDEPAEQLLAAQSFVSRTYSFKEERLHGAYSHQRLRVGYVSADFREHAVGFLLPSMLAGHDKDGIELYAYDFTAPEQTALREEIQSQFDHFKSIQGLSDREAAELIRSDEIDVLIDLHGLSAGARPGIFALHPAPLQGTYLGFIGSTGFPWLDFVVADRTVLPEELRPYFTEKPLYLEGSFLPMVSYAASNVRVSREELGIPANAFAMGAQGNTYKITPDMFASWMRLLGRIPDSVICLIDDNKACTANLREQARLHGIAQEKLIFLPRTSHDLFCAQLKLLDVYLDTYPYNCGSTTNDVVHAEVPLISMYGKTMVSRMGLSVLTALGVPGQATRTYSEYEDKVVELSLKKRTGQFKPVSPKSDPVPIGQKLKALAVGRRDTSYQPSAAVNRPSPRLEIFQICYSDETLKSVPEGFSVLDNRDNPRPDWREFWPIRQYLLTHELEDDVFYGFFSPRFSYKTQLEIDAIKAEVSSHGQDHDVLIFSPFWDLSAFFANPFLQGDLFHPGLLHASQEFADAADLDLDLKNIISHGENTVFCNYFVARKKFWIRWLELAEKLYVSAENDDGYLWAILNNGTVYGGDILPQKIFVQERLVNMILFSGVFKSKSWNMFELPSSITPLNVYLSEGVQCNALKMSFALTGYVSYLDEYKKLIGRVFSDSGMFELIAERNKMAGLP